MVCLFCKIYCLGERFGLSSCLCVCWNLADVSSSYSYTGYVPGSLVGSRFLGRFLGRFQVPGYVPGSWVGSRFQVPG